MTTHFPSDVFLSTFVCPTEIIAFSERADDFRKIDCEVVGCSTDSHFCHFAWYEELFRKCLYYTATIPHYTMSSKKVSSNVMAKNVIVFNMKTR